ncbi:MAG: DnaB-like helicase C-terminal domain-containing protein [Actinomycetota bacterium]
MNQVYKWAKRYKEIGWSVFPVNNNKTPAIAEVVPYRSRLASDEELEKWFSETEHGVAVITGKLSGIMVIDDDSAKKSGLSNDLVTKMKSTVISRTGTGGRHFFLKFEEGYGNRVNIAGKNIDVRSEGGYVIIPPTIRKVDNQELKYEWVFPPTKENLKNMPSLSSTPEVAGEVKRLTSSLVNINDYLFLGAGERNDGLFRLARSLLNRLDKRNVYDMVVNIGRNYTPPLTQHEVDTIFRQAVRYYDLNKKNTSKVPRKVSEVVEERLKEREFEKIAPKTGFPSLDDLIVGFIPGNLYCFTGDTNVGKTTMACNFAVNVARQKKKVLYIALETGNKIVEMLASIRLDKPYRELAKEDLADKESYIDLFVDRDIENIQDLEKTINSLEEHYDLVIIDHIGYFVTDRSNYLQEQANVLKRLRFITKEKKMAIMVIAHLRKRAKEQKKETAPTSDDIAGSASFKQDSTDVLIVVRQKDADDPHKIKMTDNGWLYVSKTKGNAVGSVDLKFFDTDVENKKAVVLESFAGGGIW